MYTRPWVQYAVGLSIIIFFTACYIVLLLNKYWQFEFFFTDNVFFDQALWKVSRGYVPIVHHTTLEDINILGDHFSLTIFFFSLLYLLTPRQEIIFIGMSLVYGLSAFFGMLIGFKLIKSRFVTYALLVSYFLYLGTQNAMLYGFHELILFPLFFMVAVFALLTNRTLIFWTSFLLILLTKLSLAVACIALGCFILVAFPKKRLTGCAAIVFSVLYYLAVTHIAIPYFSQRFLYAESVHIPQSIHELFFKLTVPKEKIQTFLVSTATFAFLPLANLATLPLLLQDFVIRYLFFKGGNVQYRLFYHYNLGTVPILFFASMWSIHTAQRFLAAQVFRGVKGNLVIGLVIMCAAFYFHRLYEIKGPLLLVFNRDFYAVTQKNAFLWELVEKTPRDGRIMTQNHLGLMFAHDDVVPMETRPYIFVELHPKYIVYDLRRGQNPNNYFPLTEIDTIHFMESLLSRNAYTIYYQNGSRYILKKVE